MKRICFALTVLFLVSNLCFPGEANFNRPFPTWPGGAESAEFAPSLFEFDSAYLTQELREIEEASSLQRTGRMLLFGGGLLAVMGSVFVIGSKDFGGVCCEKKYRSWGFLFLGTGSAMVAGGLLMIRKGKKIESGLALHVNPHRREAALGYRLVF